MNSYSEYSKVKIGFKCGFFHFSVVCPIGYHNYKKPEYINYEEFRLCERYV